MKSLSVLILTSIISGNLWAQNLGPDFVCKAKTSNGEEFEVLLNNYDFAKEVTLKFISKSCHFPITFANYKTKSVAEVMTLNIEPRETCSLKNYKFLEKGFLKVHLGSADEAYILAMTGQPIPCEISVFNKKKLSTRLKP